MRGGEAQDVVQAGLDAWRGCGPVGVTLWNLCFICQKHASEKGGGASEWAGPRVQVGLGPLSTRCSSPTAWSIRLYTSSKRAVPVP